MTGTSKSSVWAATGVVIVCVVVATVVAVFVTRNNDNRKKQSASGNLESVEEISDGHGDDFPMSQTYPFGIPHSTLGIYAKAGVATDATPCAKQSLDILEIGGNAVDAAISALFCNGVTHGHSSGIGGGFFMTVYVAKEKKSIFVNAREVAPLASNETMYIGRPKGSSYKGPLSIAVPGEVLGIWEAKDKFGSNAVTMDQILRPTIKMCKEGIRMTASTEKALVRVESSIRKSPELRNIFVNKKTNKTLKQGDLYKRPILGRTLETLLEKGPDAFYRGEIGEKLVKDIQDAGGIITMEDLNQYKVKIENPSRMNLLDGSVMYSSPAPGSGLITSAIVRLMDEFRAANGGQLKDQFDTYKLLVEAMKFSFARRTKIGDGLTQQEREDLVNEKWIKETVEKIKNMNETSSDPAFYGLETGSSPEDHGTSHISVIDKDGNAASVTSTINYYWGSKIVSPSTGIIMNNEMDDFATTNEPNLYGFEPSPANKVKPGRRPTSSMSPTIIVGKDGDVKMIVGGSGGSNIISAVAGVIVRNLMFDVETIKDAIDYPRIHHQLLPNKLFYEVGFPKSYVRDLESFGHATQKFDPYYGSKYAGGRVQGISIDNGIITANNDRRKDGQVAGF